MAEDPFHMEHISLGDGDPGTFVLGPQLVTSPRRSYLERGQRLIATYVSVAMYAEQGKRGIENAKKPKGPLEPTTPIRVKFGGYEVRSNFGHVERMFAGAGAELAAQFSVAVYGNFEALLADHVRAAFAAEGEAEPERSALALLSQHRWHGKLHRIAQRFSLPLHDRRLRELYRGLDLGFHGKTFTDPIEFLQAVGDTRHRIVHSSGRVDASFLAEYPDCGLTIGRLFNLPFEVPLVLWFFLVPLSDVIDRLFADRFNWHREEVRPETLV